MQDFISVFVEDKTGKRTAIEIPTGINLSLMEVLKASGYPIAATCGGIALCATCHIEVLKDTGLPEPGDAEYHMLDQLPNWKEHSRLSCQIRLKNIHDGLVFRILGEQ